VGSVGGQTRGWGGIQGGEGGHHSEPPHHQRAPGGCSGKGGSSCFCKFPACFPAAVGSGRSSPACIALTHPPKSLHGAAHTTPLLPPCPTSLVPPRHPGRRVRLSGGGGGECDAVARGHRGNLPAAGGSNVGLRASDCLLRLLGVQRCAFAVCPFLCGLFFPFFSTLFPTIFPFPLLPPGAVSRGPLPHL
jgi:hypothetical protein